MTTGVYPTYRALGRPMRFKGFQGQYILLAGGALIGDLLFFILLYTGKIPAPICLVLTFGLGAGALAIIAWLSKRFGMHGLMKHLARKHIPKHLTCKSRQPFLNLKK
jgi:hypothetical protein